MNNMMPLEIGDKVHFSKTVGESDVYLFAGITGDLNQVHMNEEYMSKTHYGKRIAHGVLSIGFISTTSSLMIEKANSEATAVSSGYDRIRFLKPIFIGDTITVNYTIAELDHENFKSKADVQVLNQHGEICTVGQHILRFITD